MKHCPDCDGHMSLMEFPPSRKNRDGRGTYCRPCVRLRQRTYRDRTRGGPARPVRRVDDGHKWCPRCAKELPHEAFGKNRSSRDGLTSYCQPCHNIVTRENRERRHGSTRNYHLVARYGMTADEVQAWVDARDGLCAVCRTRPAKHVDHDHATGRVRGVLCSGCNQGLGNFRDDAAVLRAAIDYLETPSCTTPYSTAASPLPTQRRAARPSPTSSA